MDPPIDNADPVEQAYEALKEGLRQLACEDWLAGFPILGRPSNQFIRQVAGSALRRVQELETVVNALQAIAAPSCAKCQGNGVILGPSDSGYIDCPACDGRGT